MPRPIKFRAWDKKVKHMFFWSFPEILDDHVPRIKDLDWMQFTGLKDKNGKEIYEGDYLDGCGIVFWCPEQGGWELKVPAFNDDKTDYCLGCGGDMHWFEVASEPTKFEVIGNIYQNGDLLK